MKLEQQDITFIAWAKTTAQSVIELRNILHNYAVSRLAEDGSDCAPCVQAFFMQLMKAAGLF